MSGGKPSRRAGLPEPIPSGSGLSAGRRIQQLTEGWFITEPLLFSVWTLHQRLPSTHIQTLRVGGGRIEYNPEYITRLSDAELGEVLRLEATRILLQHPYQRRRPHPERLYQASNLALCEHVKFLLPLPSAAQVFGTHEWDRQYYELYYDRLTEQAATRQQAATATSPEQREAGEETAQAEAHADGLTSEQQPQAAPAPGEGSSESSESAADLAQKDTLSSSPESLPDAPGDARGNARGKAPGNARGKAPEPALEATPLRPPTGVAQHLDASQVGAENTGLWDQDEFWGEELQQRIREAAQTSAWGSLPWDFQQLLLATLVPKLNFRKLLRGFRASLISSARALTRMRPSRRYGFQYMGSRYRFTTRLLVGIDVSGSISDQELRQALGVIQQLFRYGIEQVDALQFDTRLIGDVEPLRRAVRSFKILGRGGTRFAPILEYAAEHPEYDGLLIITDGFAPLPAERWQHPTRLLWLFNSEESFNAMRKSVQHLGRAGYIKASRAPNKRSEKRGR